MARFYKAEDTVVANFKFASGVLGSGVWSFVTLRYLFSYEISWINVLFGFGKERRRCKNMVILQALKGYSSPERGDISVFNHPYNNTIFIKRIVAVWIPCKCRRSVNDKRKGTTQT